MEDVINMKIDLFFTDFKVIITSALLVIAALAAYLWLKPEKRYRKPAVAVKCTGTLMCVFLALYGWLSGSGAGRGYIVLALLVCTLADGLLEYNFIAGMAAFLCAHALYITAFIKLSPLSWWSLLAAAVYAAVVLLLNKKILPRDRFFIPKLLYITVLGAMFSFAFPLCLAKGVSGVVIAVGAALFVISDAYLSTTLSREPARRDGFIVMTTYYAAQYLLALALVL